MKSFASKLFVVSCLMAVVSLGWVAAQGQEGKKKKGDPTAKLKKKLEEAELPADVLEKCNKIVAEHGPKIAAAQAKVDAVLTDEQRSAQKAAKKAAKDAGKKGKEAQAEIDAAVKLTEEQKPKMEAARKELNDAENAMNDALRAVLSAEQQEKVGIKAKKKKKND
jgi:hypothetical protein